MIKILYHTQLVLLSYGELVVAVLLIIILFTTTIIKDDYKPTVVLSLMVSVILVFFVTERKEQFDNIPIQVCETHIRVVDTISKNITYNKNGMLLVHYDTNKITNNSTLDTVKTNCTYISE